MYSPPVPSLLPLVRVFPTPLTSRSPLLHADAGLHRVGAATCPLSASGRPAPVRVGRSGFRRSTPAYTRRPQPASASACARAHGRRATLKRRKAIERNARGSSGARGGSSEFRNTKSQNQCPFISVPHFAGSSRIDVVVLSEPIQRERDREHEEHRDDARVDARRPQPKKARAAPAPTGGIRIDSTALARRSRRCRCLRRLPTRGAAARSRSGTAPAWRKAASATAR